MGSLTIQLSDVNSTQIFNHDAGIIFSDYNKDILMNNYASGIFYLKMSYVPINGKAKTGVYKIIKLISLHFTSTLYSLAKVSRYRALRSSLVLMGMMIRVGTVALRMCSPSHQQETGLK